MTIPTGAFAAIFAPRCSLSPATVSGGDQAALRSRQPTARAPHGGRLGASTLAILLLLTSVSRAATLVAEARIDRAHGALQTISVGGTSTSVSSEGGGFRVVDAATKGEIELAPAATDQKGGAPVFVAEKSGDLRLRADFMAGPGFIRVNGSLTNLREGERGVVLDYTLPMEGTSAVFGPSLNEAITLRADSRALEGNLYPLGTLSRGDRSGLALAIPPDRPCIFGVVGDRRGLTIRFYLGLSPAAAQFVNRADFSFLIYPVGTDWGFRRALSAYYSFFPDYYQVRTKKFGYLMFGTTGQERPDMDFYALNRVALNANLEADLQRDKKYGLASVVYVNPGTRELAHLPKMPKNLDEAWQVYQDLCGAVAEEWTQGGPEPSDCELISSSACGLSTGKYAMSPRYTGWGQNTVSFKTNPNPALFGGIKRSVGEVTLKNIDHILDEHPALGGVCVDSLGANWPATLNYRRDHFAAAKYPLTVDASGRVALHNELSYCEFLDALRTDVRARGGIIYGNGIYSYPSRTTIEPEHYRGRGVTLGRFFMAARIDIGSCEAGIRSNQERFEFIKVAMGRKLYDVTNSEWDDLDVTKAWFNKCLLYGIFGENVRRYDSDPAKIRPYLPEGYARDRETIAWFVRNVRLLDEAGWEPVTLASAGSKDVRVERYGSGQNFYLAVMADGKQPQDCTIKLDLPALGLASGRFGVEEIAQKVAPHLAKGGEIELKLQPGRTCVLKVSAIP